MSSATGYDKNYKEGNTHNYSFTVEREIFPNWGVQVSYRGVINRDLLWGRNLNSVPASATPWSQSRLPWPQLGAINYVENGGTSWYRGLEFRLTRPWVTGLYTTVSFTEQWSGGLHPTTWGYSDDQMNTYPEYPFDRNRDNVAMAQEWPSHDFLWTFVGDLPVGSGSKINIDNKEYIIIKEEDILGILV